MAAIAVLVTWRNTCLTLPCLFVTTRRIERVTQRKNQFLVSRKNSSNRGYQMSCVPRRNWLSKCYSGQLFVKLTPYLLCLRLIAIPLPSCDPLLTNFFVKLPDYKVNFYQIREITIINYLNKINYIFCEILTN